MDKEGIILEPSRSPDSLRIREDIPITMESPTTTMALRMEMGMDQVVTRAALPRPHPLRRISAISPISSEGRMDIMPRTALKLRMGMEMEAPGRSPARSTKDK